MKVSAQGTRYGLRTPALLVDLERLERNLQAMQAFADEQGVRLRPHAKTHKTPAIGRMQVAMGASGLTVAKLGEAEVFLDAGIDDLFVAYPIVGEEKLERLAGLLRRGRVTVAADHREQLDGYAALSRRRGLEVPVMIEVDTGLARCGLPPGRELVELCLTAARTPGLRFLGLMTHEGHAPRAGHPEGLHGAGVAAGQTMVEAAAMVRREGVEVEVVSVGSTPTARSAPTVAGVTEMRPGIYAFYDAGRVAMGVVDGDRCAATVLATIVSRPARDRVILDAGSKALSQDGLGVRLEEPSFGQVLAHPDWRIERLYEEHAILRVPPGDAARIGEQVRIVPNHVCPVFNLFDRVSVVREGEVVDEWPIEARGRSQ